MGGQFIKEFIVAVWEMRKQYSTESRPSQPQSQPLAGDQGPVAGVVGRVGKLVKSSHSRGKLHECHDASVSIIINVCVAPPILVSLLY